MDIRRRSLFKSAAGGALLVTGASYLVNESSFFWNIWHHLRHRAAMNEAPVKNPDITARKQGHETVLYSRSQQRDLIKLNTMAGRIWEMCDGTHRVDDIIRGIGNRYDVLPSECTRDILTTIASLEQRKLLIT